MSCRATEDGQVIGKGSDKTWSIGGGNGKHSSIFATRTPMNNMKRQKDITPEDESPPGQKVSSMLLGRKRRQLLIASERMKHLGQNGNAQL